MCLRNENTCARRCRVWCCYTTWPTSTTRCRSAHLVFVQPNHLLSAIHIVLVMRTAASTAMPPWQAIASLCKSEVDGDCVRLTTRRQSDSEDRSKSNRLDIKQGRHLIRQALQFFELLACNGGGKGQGPLRSLGGPRGIFSHVREYPPLVSRRAPRSPSRAYAGKGAALSGYPSLRAARGKHLRPCRRKKRAPLRVLFFKSLRISRTGTSGRLRR